MFELRVFVYFFRLCIADWKRVAGWVLIGGPLLLLWYGTGSASGFESSWWKPMIVGNVLGLFIGMMVLIDKNCRQKHRRVKSGTGDRPAIEKHEWTIVAVGVGVLCGLLLAFCLELTALGYVICVAVFVGLGMLRGVFLESL